MKELLQITQEAFEDAFDPMTDDEKTQIRGSQKDRAAALLVKMLDISGAETRLRQAIDTARYELLQDTSDFVNYIYSVLENLPEEMFNDLYDMYHYEETDRVLDLLLELTVEDAREFCTKPPEEAARLILKDYGV